MPNLDPDRYPPRPAGPAGGGSTLGDFIAGHPEGPCSSSDCPYRHMTAAPCPECWGQIGHAPSCSRADIELCRECDHAVDDHDRRGEDGVCDQCLGLAQLGQWAPCSLALEGREP